jgi:UDPglucose 6-dehydrogenase
MLKEGAHVSVYDTKGMEKAREIESIKGASFVNSPMEAVEGAEALVVATEWSEFGNIDLATVKEKMHTPMIFDGRNLFDPQTMATLGFHYTSIGRARVTPR